MKKEKKSMNNDYDREYERSAKHWEVHYSLSEPSRNMELTEGSDFAPKNPTNRKTTYVKINRQDH